MSVHLCSRCGAETVPILDDEYRWNWRCSDFRCQYEEPDTEHEPPLFYQPSAVKALRLPGFEEL